MDGVVTEVRTVGVSAGMHVLLRSNQDQHMGNTVVVRPTTSCFADWLNSKRRHVTEHYRMSGGRLTCDIYSTLFLFTCLL